MYTRLEARLIKQKFWTSLGQYMKPVPSASQEKVNWLNYKTGVKDVYIRMHAANNMAAIGIEITHTDSEMQHWYFEHLQALRSILESHTGETWLWQPQCYDDAGKIISRVQTTLEGANLMKQEDWPVLIAFFKPRLIALDAFWWEVKDGFENL
jgi:hypothetical protein